MEEVCLHGLDLFRFFVRLLLSVIETEFGSPFSTAANNEIVYGPSVGIFLQAPDLLQHAFAREVFLRAQS